MYFYRGNYVFFEYIIGSNIVTAVVFNFYYAFVYTKRAKFEQTSPKYLFTGDGIGR